MFACNTGSGQLMSNLDVCKTPTPPGAPVPVPYTNIGLTAQCMPAATKVLIAGMPGLNKNAQCVPSSGDEPGVAGGAVSSLIKGPVTFTTSSLKVMVQGSPAVRMNDLTMHNQNNAPGRVSLVGQFKVMINS